ncbi:nuclear transport factor 2 family protein [Chloroflexota bacterium]
MTNNREMAQELKGLKQKLQILEDKEAIRDHLARYSFNADLNRTDAYLDLWTEDGSFEVGGEVGLGRIWKGRDEIKQLLNGPVHQSFTTRSQHLLVDYIINVDGDTATAAGYGVVTVHWPGGFGIRRCSLRTFHFRRCEGRWFIQNAVSLATGDPECHSLISPDV